jgi:hypothetical protein
VPSAGRSRLHAAGWLEGRLLQAQAEKPAPIDFLSTLVQDELLKRQDRLLERRIRYAGFRDAGKTRGRPSFDTRRTGGSPVSALCSMFSQLLKLFPPTEFLSLLKRYPPHPGGGGRAFGW